MLNSKVEGLVLFSGFYF